MSRVLYQDRFKETTFDKIYVGKTFYTDYNGERNLYIRIGELADPDNATFRYNAVRLDIGAETFFDNATKVVSCDVTFVAIPFLKEE